MDQRVTVEIKDGVADVRLIRTDKMNALDDAMFAALVEAGETLKVNPAVRAVVLSGDGRAFCAGLDASNFGRMASGGGAGGGEGGQVTSGLGSRTHGIANRAQYAVWVWRELEVPVIAAVHGFAYGGGFQLMLGADMRYVTPDAKLAILEIKWGLVPDMAGTQLMRHLVRDDLIRELTYTGRIFSGAEAVEMGFATHAFEDPRAEALKVAHEIAGKNPHAIRAAKRIYNHAPYRSAADGLMDESIEQGRLIGSPNQVEAVMANLQQRAPKFAD